MDKRQYPRFSFNGPVGYQRNEEYPENGSLCIDVSQGGVKLRSSEFIPLHTLLDLKLHLKNPSRLLSVKGQVIWVREVPHSEIFDVGIRFIEPQKIIF